MRTDSNCYLDTITGKPLYLAVEEFGKHKKLKWQKGRYDADQSPTDIDCICKWVSI